MRKLATAVAVSFATLIANAALACEEEHAQLAEQPQPKPAVAKKATKQHKQQKAKKAEQTEKTAVARADKG